VKAIRPHNFKDLNGQTFGRLTVEGEPFYKGQFLHWPCKCTCGQKTNVATRHLNNKSIQSCGCFGREKSREAATTHGLGKPPEYGIWSGMWDRCTNANGPKFKDYGGRGIKVCDRWEKFENFYSDMGSRPSNSHEIDRYPDNDGNYEPSNCRWATKKEQCNNRRSCRMFTFRNRTQSLKLWCEDLRMNYDMVQMRLRAGLSIEEALTRPHRGWGRNLKKTV
jgi:hypothetical protein